MTATLPNIDEAIYQAVRWYDEGLSFSESGQFVAAGELLDRALRSFEKHFGSECPDVANVLNARGLVAETLGDVSLARASFERAVRIIKPVFEETAPDRDVARIHVQALNNLGQLERNVGHYDAAGRIFDEALQIARRWLGETDLDTSMILKSLENSSQGYKASFHFVRVYAI